MGAAGARTIPFVSGFERKVKGDPESILVVLPTWVGDFVMATPALRAIRDRYDRAHITFLMEPNLRDLVRGGDWMDDAIEWPPKDRRRPWHRAYRRVTSYLRRQRIDWAVLFPNSARSALMAYLARAERRFGYNRDGRRLLLTDPIEVRNRCAGRYVPMPIVQYYADLVEAIGCDRPGDRLELFTTPDCDRSVDARLVDWGIERHRPLVVLSPGASYGAAKCWPTDRYAGVADHFATQRESAIVITCGPGEEPIAKAVQASMKQQAQVCVNPLLTLGELKSLIKRADLLLCNDTGPRHLAKAFGVPVVTVFGPTHPEWTATNYEAERIVRIDIECGPCQERICPLGHLACMTGVSIEAVCEAATTLLGPRTTTGLL